MHPSDIQLSLEAVRESPRLALDHQYVARRATRIEVEALAERVLFIDRTRPDILDVVEGAFGLLVGKHRHAVPARG